MSDLSKNISSLLRVFYLAHKRGDQPKPGEIKNFFNQIKRYITKDFPQISSNLKEQIISEFFVILYKSFDKNYDFWETVVNVDEESKKRIFGYFRKIIVSVKDLLERQFQTNEKKILKRHLLSICTELQQENLIQIIPSQFSKDYLYVNSAYKKFSQSSPLPEIPSYRFRDTSGDYKKNKLKNYLKNIFEILENRAVRISDIIEMIEIANGALDNPVVDFNEIDDTDEKEAYLLRTQKIRETEYKTLAEPVLFLFHELVDGFNKLDKTGKKLPKFATAWYLHWVYNLGFEEIEKLTHRYIKKSSAENYSKKVNQLIGKVLTGVNEESSNALEYFYLYLADEYRIHEHFPVNDHE